MPSPFRTSEARSLIDTGLDTFAVRDIHRGASRLTLGLIGSGRGDEGSLRAVWGGNVSPPELVDRRVWFQARHTRRSVARRLIYSMYGPFFCLMKWRNVETVQVVANTEGPTSGSTE